MGYHNNGLGVIGIHTGHGMVWFRNVWNVLEYQNSGKGDRVALAADNEWRLHKTRIDCINYWKTWIMNRNEGILMRRGIIGIP